MTTQLVMLMTALLAAPAPPASADQAAQQGAAAARLDPAGGVSIEELVDLAMRDAPAILAARSREVEAQGAETQARLRPNPVLGVQRREEADTPGHQTTIGVTWPLDLFRRDGRTAVAAADTQLAGGATADLRWRLAGRVRAQAGRVLAAIRRLEIADEVARVTRETFDLVSARASTGAGPVLDRNQAEIAWRRHQADATRLRGELEAELATLKALVGLDASTPLVLRDDLEASTAVLRAGTTAQAAPGSTADWLGARPDLRIADMLVGRATATEAQARREARFDVALVASYSRARAGFPQQGLDRSGALVPIAGRTHSLIVGANVTLPWRNDNRGRVAAASAAVVTAERAREARRLDAGAEVEAARQRDASAAAALDLLRGDARGLAASNLDVVRESYTLGRASLTDVLDETRRYLDFESAYTNALADAFQARVALTTALGAIR